MSTQSREEKAKLFDNFLYEHDKLSREVSILNAKFDKSGDDEKKIKDLKKLMQELQNKAALLGS
jgi:hypothetical protein